MDRADLGHRTIADFGEQWTVCRDNAGRYGSTTYLFDIVVPAHYRHGYSWTVGGKP